MFWSSEAPFGVRRQAKRDAALDWDGEQERPTGASLAVRSQSAVAAWDRLLALCRTHSKEGPDCALKMPNFLIAAFAGMTHNPKPWTLSSFSCHRTQSF